MNAKRTEERLPSPWVSAVPLAVLTVLLYVVIRCFGGDAINGGSQIALLSAASVCVMLSIGIYRCRWAVLEEAIIDNIRASASAILILLLIGAIAGSWMVSGVVPTLICYGLHILHPSFFLVASCLICAGVSLMTGSSWTTIATIGVALMGIGQAMGFPEGWVAGAIISGAYFGDKISLLSDTTVLASSTVGVPVFTHIRYMLYTTVPATLVALGLYWYLGLNYSGGAMPDLTPITDALSANFNRSFLLALPPIVLVALAIRGIPPLPTLVIAILVGVVCAFVIQDGMTVKGIFKAATDGYVSQTGHPLVDKILSRGGLTSMSFVVFLLLIAMTLGGILEGTGALGVVVDRMTRSVTSPGGLILATLVSCYLMTIGTGNGMLSIIVPARAFEKKFRDMGIQSRVLSRTLEDAVTLGIALVPYSMAAFFIVGVLKIDAMQYIPYAFVNWIVPIFSLTYGFTGFAIWKINKDAGNSPAESEA